MEFFNLVLELKLSEEKSVLVIFLPVLLGPDFGRTDAATEPTRAAIGRGGGPFVFCSLVEQLFASSATGAKAAVDHQKGADAKTKASKQTANVKARADKESDAKAVDAVEMRSY